MSLEPIRRTRDYFLCFVTLLLFFSAAAVTRAEFNVTTRFDPPKIALGNTARYIVEIVETSASSMPEPEEVNSLPIPESGGLTLRNGRLSTSTQIRSVNFKTQFTRTVTLSIDASASKTGVFSVPGFTFTYKGERLIAPLATLEVLERSADAGPTLDELLFLKTDAPDQLYVGQTVDITLKLYISDSVSISNLESFTKSANGFTVSELPDSPVERTEMFNGRRYRTLNWPLTITPISAGEQDLNFEFVVIGRLPGDEQRGRRSPFGSSIFDNFFGQNERFNIYTEPTSIKVLTLPEQGKPQSFSGAVGDFNMQVYTDMDSTKVGEPIMLSVKVSGTGNFDRIQGPPIAPTKQWRHYDPEAVFESNGNNSNSGVKRFDYIFIANQAGKLKLPEIKFSFFDPATREYVELRSPGIPITVAPSNRPTVTPQGTSTQSNRDNTLVPAAPEQIPLSVEEALMTLDYRPKPSRKDLSAEPLRSPLIIGVNLAGLAGLIAGGFWLAQKKRQSQDPQYAARTQLRADLKVALADAQTTAGRGDGDAFFNAAQRAIRLSASIKANKSLRTASADEVAEALLTHGVDDSEVERARNLMLRADKLRFSGGHGTVDIQTAERDLDSVITKLSK